MYVCVCVSNTVSRISYSLVTSPPLPDLPGRERAASGLTGYPVDKRGRISE